MSRLLLDIASFKGEIATKSIFGMKIQIIEKFAILIFTPNTFWYKNWKKRDIFGQIPITVVVAVLRGNCPEQQSYMTVKILSTQKATKNKEPLW